MVLSGIKQYAHWLHGQWPAGKAEKLPLVNPNLTTSIPGVYIVGDLTGVPLLKFAADSGARAVDNLLKDPSFKQRKADSSITDVVIIGAGIAGCTAAMQAKAAGLSFQLLESSEAFSTIKNFPAGKPIYTYPADMQPAGALSLTEKESTRETLYQSVTTQMAESGIATTQADVSHIEQATGCLAVICEPRQVRKAHRVIIAIGKSGNFKTLDVPGENTAKVVNRLHDPAFYSDQNVAIVGGGDSALEAAIAIAAAQKKPAASGALTLVHRDTTFARAKPENRAAVETLAASNQIQLQLAATVESIENDSITLKTQHGIEHRDNDAVLTLLGREAPLDFFRRSNLPIKGESTPLGWFALFAFLLFVTGLYDWKNYGFLNSLWGITTFPDAMPQVLSGLGPWWEATIADRSTLLGTIAVSMKSRSFYYTVLYTACIGYFGWQRINRRKTPYIRLQTWCLFLIQCIPLFLLPEIILPWLGYNGAFDTGIARSVVDSLFPSYISAAELAAQAWPDWGHPRAYWHAYGFILAWPLSVYNVFTPSPMMGWLIICFVQTFVLIPALIYRYGKGAYCGWICSCGALAETMGDTQRHKMPHGKASNRWNFVGQVLLAIAFVLLAIRIYGWIAPESWAAASFDLLLKGENSDYALVNPISWKWSVDVLMGGILGVGLYFKYSGRVWCRFACPLAALMNIYTRFSRFRILSEKEKCISCNQCTSICHQGIDVMAFANQGKPMEDPQCVRCSACVEVCPTGVLAFGEVDRNTNKPIRYDTLQANKLHTQPVHVFDPKNGGQ
ncbi:MAG: NAD(P)-binding domain-containing protein [Halioglobus sp.]